MDVHGFVLLQIMFMMHGVNDILFTIYFYNFVYFGFHYTIPGLTNVWHACPQRHALIFAWQAVFPVVPFFKCLLLDQRLYIVKNMRARVCIYTGLFISPSGISELDCATTKTDTAERSISIGRESLQVFFCTRGLVVLPGSTARG